ncbi:sigma-54-dependent Fis family transcriptional regulator [Sporosarcina sp. FSL W7-1349]|uniref:sigma-54-dependent Fis family transcriptional regulator n=1 Tax=Sporosarcina sp. FSL W7-1349 TaxID=2921561 RepID=UPI0030FC4B91
MNCSSADAIKKSQERSKKYGVDFANAKNAILPEYELRQHRQRKEYFLQDIYPTLEHLAHFLKPSHAIVSVSDPSGIIIESIGDPKFLKDAEKIHVQNGACWSEEIRGTNSAGTVSIERKTLAVVGKDHYLEPHHMLYCIGSPIFDPSGNLLAVLNVSGYSDLYQPSLLQFTDAIARKIENRMLLCQADPQIVISLLPKENADKQALLSLNQHGHLIGANREALHLLNLKKLSPQEMHISELLMNSEQLLQGTVNESVVHLHKPSQEDSRFLASTLIDTRPRSTSFSKIEKKPIRKTKISRYSFQDLYGKDKAFQSALQIAKRAAATDYTIMITGESGTGKEMVSQAVHNASPRAEQPFVALNCGGITKSLMESELFGYEPGAFTGAKQSGHAGVFERANGGTLLLDEIAELPMEIQIALLRVLQDFQVTRVGGTKPKEIDVRIITATHTELWKKVQDGSFREDLFYRLQGIHVELPPLRERTDRLQYAFRLLKDIQSELNVSTLILSNCAQQLIENYTWPGNVRQLVSALREAAFLSQNSIINFHCFPTYIRTHFTQMDQSAESALEELENEAILKAMQKTDGNISQSARLLGIGRTTLYRKLKKLKYPI